MANGNASSSLAEIVDPKTGEVFFMTSSGAVMTHERYSQRVRNVLKTKSIGNFTGTLAEDHMLYLLQQNTKTRFAGVIDRLSGKMPDLFVELESGVLFVEVKTVGPENQLVIKRAQLESFAERGKNCVFAFTEHNLVSPREVLGKKNGAEWMTNQFRLRKILFVDVASVLDMYNSEDLNEYAFKRTADGSYKNIRLNKIRKVLEGNGVKLKSSMDGQIWMAGNVPELLPSESILCTQMSSSIVNCEQEFSKRKKVGTARGVPSVRSELRVSQ